jgi:hypothetical protein
MTDFMAKLRDLEDRLQAACNELVDRRCTAYVNSIEMKRVFVGWQSECGLSVCSFPALQCALAPYRGPDPTKFSDSTNFYTKDELMESAKQAIREDIDNYVEIHSVKRRPRDDDSGHDQDGFVKRACV